MLGTTHATNAVLERRNLRRVAVLRIGAPATFAIRPMFGWPATCGPRSRSARRSWTAGSSSTAGRCRRSTPTPSPAFSARSPMWRKGVAITSVFAPVSPRHELAAARSCAGARRHPRLAQPRDRLDRPARAGERDHPERCADRGGPRRRRRDPRRARRLRPGARHVLRAERRHPDGPRLRAALPGAHDRQRAGQLDPRRRVPHRHGPTRSSSTSAGPRTDVGVLVERVPARVDSGVEIGGIRTNFRMPDLVTIALGGGTCIHVDPARMPIGPRSVGYLLKRGGARLRRVDADADRRAVAAGRASLGDASRRLADIEDVLARALAGRRDDARRGDRPGEDLQGGPRPLIAVGGGSILVPDAIPGRQRGHPARALRRGERDRRRHRLGQRPGGPDLPPGRRRPGGRRRRRRREEAASARSRPAPPRARCRSSSWKRSRSPTSPPLRSGSGPRPRDPATSRA